MERGRVNKKQAMLASNKLTREMKEAQRRLAADGLGPKAGSAAKPLDQAALQMQQAADARTPPPAQGTQPRHWSERLGGPGAGREPVPPVGSGAVGAATPGQKSLAEMAQALERRDFDAAARVLNALAERLKSGEMSEAEAQDAATALAKMSEALKDTDLEAVSKELQEALKQLEQLQKLAANLTPEQREQLRKLAMRRAGEACGKAGGT
jgi:hypothetical protein